MSRRHYGDTGLGLLAKALLVCLALPPVVRGTQCIYSPLESIGGAEKHPWDTVQCRTQELGRLTAYPTNETVYDATGHYQWPNSLPTGIVGLRQFNGALEFKFHDIPEITETSFEHVPYASIRELSLSQNEHTRVGPRSFRRFGNTLMKIRLSKNKITYMAPGAFVDLTHLDELTLWDNRIEAFDYGVFATFPRLCVAGTNPQYYESAVYGPSWALAGNPFDLDRATYDAGCFTEQANFMCYRNVAPPIGTVPNGNHVMCRMVESGECGRMCDDGAVACPFSASSVRPALAEPPAWCIPGNVVAENDGTSNNGLGAGAIAGITVGAAVFVALGGYHIYGASSGT